MMLPTPATMNLIDPQWFFPIRQGADTVNRQTLYSNHPESWTHVHSECQFRRFSHDILHDEECACVYFHNEP